MISSPKIRSTHLERRAYVYVRQSTLMQVTHHLESTERQYHLQERAMQLGWPATGIEVIDEDQGTSGSSSVHRLGFQRLVSAVGLGEVGVVLMLEASRLARSCSDWHRLIEICSLSHTLIADEMAVYDPREPNDRLLLGVKGTLSEAELFTLRTRLYEGRWNKARKGLLHHTLPVGYIHGPTGSWELDPDTHVQERLAYLFGAMKRHGVARRVCLELKEHDLKLPVRVVTRESYGQLVWKPATFSAVMRILQNPAYAGTFVYGQFEYSGERRSAKTGKAIGQRRPRGEWPVCLQGHHPAYITWEEFVHNQDQLRRNWYRDMNRGAPREGSALLQGIVLCGRCGRSMRAQYRAAQERRSPIYLCPGDYADGGKHICQSMTGRPVDEAVTRAFLEAVEPARLQVALRVLDQVEADLRTQRRQWELQLEQARYEARLAQRQYDAVDPDNRLVAAELERRWNEKLTTVARLEQAHAKAEQETRWEMTAAERVAIREMSQDLPAVWHAPTTTVQERKRLLRFAIDTVQLDSIARPGQIEIQIHWHSGAVSTLVVDRPAPGSGSLTTSEEVVRIIQQQVASHTYEQIAERLNARGFQTAFGHRFDARHVGYLCRRHGVARRRPRSPKNTAHKAVQHLQGKESGQ